MKKLREFIRRVRVRIAIMLIILAFALEGCAGPHVKYIPVPCKQPEERTAPFPADNLSPDADIFTQAKTLLIDRQERKSDRLVLTTALKACR